MTTLGDLQRLGVCIRFVPCALDRFGAYESLTVVSRRAVGVALSRRTKR